MAVGAVLTQEEGDNERPMAYTICKLLLAEKRPDWRPRKLRKGTDQSNRATTSRVPRCVSSGIRPSSS
ncbi:hypothetical protein Y1Q_0005270 [Alligator mississippiensis]|uniref:Uncharacterized protein n=1 Tax=Alligator mississippiensis TaxID=8496 RepID=A0A151MTB4_ALLMI|nr:hypothetical protein Y1Q_0005270 [Alligator mississippiensis]